MSDSENSVIKYENGYFFSISHFFQVHLTWIVLN